MNGIVAVFITGAAFLAGAPALADPVPVLSLGTAAPQGADPSPRSTSDGNNYAAQVLILTTEGNKGLGNAILDIQAVRRDAKTSALLETLPLKEVLFDNCSVNNLPVACPIPTGAISNGTFRFVFDALAPATSINVVVVSPTTRFPDGIMSVEATIKASSSTGKPVQLTAAIAPVVSLGPASFSTKGYIPSNGGQVTAQGLNPAESSLVNALTTVVTIPENAGNSTLSSRMGKIVHGVDLNSCSPMWAVCLHSGISIPDTATPATFSRDDPLKVLVKIDASAFRNGGKFGNVVVQYKSTPDAVPVDIVPCDGDFAAPKLPFPADTERCYLKDDTTRRIAGTLTGYGQIVVLELQNGLLLFR